MSAPQLDDIDALRQRIDVQAFEARVRASLQ